MATLTIAGSETPIEDEYRRFMEAISRCKPQEVAFDAAAFDPAAVTRAREMWRARMRAEHESVPVFLALGREVISANATLDAQAVVLRMAADEVRHAQICGEAVQALGGAPTCEVSLEGAPAAADPSAGPEERALRSVIFGSCMVEMINTANLVDIHDTMSEPYLREATRRLLADEVLHGAFGYHYLEAWAPWLEARPEVRRSLERYLRRAFASLEQIRSGVGAPPRTLTADDIALGLPDPKRLPEVFYQTVEAAIVPGLERFGLDAAAAFRGRALE